MMRVGLTYSNLLKKGFITVMYVPLNIVFNFKNAIF